MSYCRWSRNPRCDLYVYQEYISSTFVINVQVGIGLSFDGCTFREKTLSDFKQRLLDLKSIGYQFPEYVLDRVNEELKIQG